MTSAAPEPERLDAGDEAKASLGGAQERIEQRSAETVYSVSNIFFDRVGSLEAQMGITGAEARRRLTGPLLDEDVECVVGRYVRPTTFAEAEEVLRRHRVVILQGREGIGKRAGALALLDGARAARPIVALSPALPLDEVARHDFHAGRGYVLHDWTAEPLANESLSFSLQAVRSALAQCGAWLVITSARSAHAEPLREVTVRFEPPPPEEVVDACLVGTGVGGEAQRRIKERFTDCRTPRTVVDFAARVDEAATDDPERLEELLDESQHDEVARCFDDQPDPDWLALAAALAFMHALSEPAFERALDSLETRLWPPTPGSHGGDDGDEAEPRALAQARHSRAQAALVALRDEHGGELGIAAERRLAFASDAYRERVLKELWLRYDKRLWDPLTAWVRDLAASDDPDAQLSVSLGVALLAQVAGRQTRSDFLDAWATGGRNERSVAAYTIWWLALRDTSAPYALATAIEWAQGRNAARRLTAMLSLSGPLGVRFPGEALRWLWHLYDAGPATAADARRAMAALFCAGVAADEPNSPVPSFLAAKLRTARRRGSGAKGVDPVLRVINQVVTARVDHGPAAARLLARKRAAATQVGPLWAEVLMSRPFRGEALAALRETLRSLHRTQRSDSIAALGRAIVGALPSYEIALLERDLYRELRDACGRDTDADAARSIVDVLLTPAPPLSVPTPGGAP